MYRPIVTGLCSFSEAVFILSVKRFDLLVFIFFLLFYGLV